MTNSKSNSEELTPQELAWREYVFDYDIAVSGEVIEREIKYIELDLRHRMQYDKLSGGDDHFFPEQEIADQANEIRKAAIFEAKEPLVLAKIIALYEIDVTSEELEIEAKKVAHRQGTSIESVKRFFGDDFSMLRRDIVERKAMELVLNTERFV